MAPLPIPSLWHEEREFEEALEQAIDRFEIINRLDELIAYPQFVLDRYTHQLPALHELDRYLSVRPWTNVPRAITIPPTITNVPWAILSYFDQDEELRELLDEMHKLDPACWVRPDVLPEHHEQVKRHLAQRITLLDFAAVINFNQMLINIQWAAERRRDETALLQLIQLDKTALYSSYIKFWMIEKQYAGDWAFFERVGKALGKPILNGAPRWHKAVLIVAYFWEGFFSKSEWPMDRIFRLLKDKKVLARQDTLRAFKTRLNRAGLKKPRYNQK